MAEKVEQGSGCVFCDLDLGTKQAGLGGGHYHHIEATKKSGEKVTKIIRCPIQQ